MRKIKAIYSIIVGVSMLAMWVMFYVTDGIPELITKPMEIYIHIFAEAVTALMLIAAGYGLLRELKWGVRLYLIASGMLLYTLINSSGYFIQNGDVAMVTMFFVLTIITLFLLIRTGKLDV